MSAPSAAVEPTEQQVTIEGMAYGGDSVGRLASGKTVFVPYGAPGDQLTVQIEQSRRSYARAGIRQIVFAGAARRNPICEHFGDCGGCQWQHLSYEQQLVQKAAIVRRALRHVVPEEAWEPFVAAPTEWSYRRRCRLHFRITEDGVCQIGYLARKSDQIVALKRCPLLRDSLNDAIRILNEGLPDCAMQLPASGSIALTESSTGTVHASIRMDAGTLDPDKANAAFAIGPIVGLTLAQGPKLRAFGTSEIVAGLSDVDDSLGGGIRTSSTCFLQANAAIESRLCHWVSEAIGADQSSVLELFAGCGTFTVSLARRASSLVAVERNAESLAFLRRNVANATRDFDGKAAAGAFRFLAESAQIALWEIQRQKQCFDVALIDPPREGCLEVIPMLAQVVKKRIAYVSCDPNTLARDLAALLECKRRFAVRSAIAFDMVPHTFHAEVAVLLEAE